MDWQSLLKTVAPWIGTALGGPLGGMAVTAAANALGLSDKTKEGLQAALSGATPEQMLALKQADQAFQVQMTEIGYKNIADLESLAAQDRASARAMQISAPSWVPAALTILVTCGYFGVLVGMMTNLLKATDSQVLLMMLGSLTTAWGAVMAYWFGTTRDSSKKTDLLAQSSPPK